MEEKDVAPNNFTENIEIIGANEHNLKNINLTFPRDKFVVITGVSGSGKSSLAFDTIYAEGQRRYIECFNTYARNFLNNLSRPEVDKIEGLSPVIAIEQKTTGSNSRSTVGTLTEIYDFLRLLYSKVSTAYSYLSGEKMIKQSESAILETILKKYNDKKVIILSPIVKNRKGSYKEILYKIKTQGYTKVRIDGKIYDLDSKISLDRHKLHSIEIVIDKITISDSNTMRVENSYKLAMKEGKGTIIIIHDDIIKYFSKHLMDPKTGLSYDEPAPNLFSFNSPIGACRNCSGLGEELITNLDNIIPNNELSIKDGGILPLGKYKKTWQHKIIETILKNNEISFDTPIKDIPKDIFDMIMYGTKDTIYLDYNGEGWNVNFKGVIEYIKRKNSNKSIKEVNDEEDFVTKKICNSCNGLRLNQQALSYKINNENISQIANLDMIKLYDWVSNLNNYLTEREKKIAEIPIIEIYTRLQLIINIGINYLTLNRPIKTLSGGEAQRIRLATQIGNQLVGVLYILDEPSIGLHSRDNEKLIQALQLLKEKGNSILIVEHDKEIMLKSDFIIEVGPGAGKFGGEIVAQGSPEEFLKTDCITAQFLNNKKQIEIPEKRRKGNGKHVIITECSGHNLKNVSLDIHLGKMNCITGVSGSGKSTLIHDTFSALIRKYLYRNTKEPLEYKEIIGLENIDKLIEIDQKPIGRTPRSNPVTFTGIFTIIRSIFSNLPEAKIRGYKPGRFSFNIKGGRCEACEGAGIKLLDMDFLPSVRMPCETCRGKRYNRETLEIRYKGKSIADILDMTVDEAIHFFDKYPRILQIIKTLKQVGLGYISLGQHATTISGGEAQRVKLASELSKKDTGNTIYVLDEPSTGLHFQDIQHLLNVLNKLIDKGNTIIVIEHNMDIIKVADHIIDIGLEGGARGGEIIAQGTPEEIVKIDKGYTAKFLRQELKLN